MVAWMNGHVPPGRYAPYVCHAGCFDWTAMFADDAWAGTPRNWAPGTGTTWPKVLRRARTPSPATCNTPTLVIHGALDYRVPDAQGLAYYNTLKARRRRAAAVVPRREPLDPEAAQQPHVVRRVLRLAEEAHDRGARAPH
jgi:dipeptidyl aminopeptidase/acylaminoacyl peptidase